MAIKTPQGSIIDIPRGTSDFGTTDAISMNEINSVIEEIFKRFGFSPIITPAIENTEVLNAKAYGQESTKEMYIIEGGEAALRFDLTVPLARFMAMNKDIQLPFKRYQIDKVWRKDEPQRMRSREFFQADIDIIGSSEASSDAECIAATLLAIEALGIRNYTLLLNSRAILNSILTRFSIPEQKRNDAIKILDKMSKVSITETLRQFASVGIDEKLGQPLISFLTEQSSNGDKLNKLEMNMANAKPDKEKLTSVLDILGSYGLKGEIKVDFSLARGLDYYTGLVWEVVIETEEGRLPSVASGGRYDGLIGMYSKSQIPAVGSSIGVSRIFEILKNKNEMKTYAKAFMAQIGKGLSDYSIKTASKLRSSGMYVDMNVTERGISKQLEHAGGLGIRYVIIIGKQEADSKKVKLRDMQTGTEELLDVDEVITRLKK